MWIERVCVDHRCDGVGCVVESVDVLESQRDENEAQVLVVKSTLSSLRDTDLAEAISQLTLEQTTLDAAQAVFARITSSSLFNFLK